MTKRLTTGDRVIVKHNKRSAVIFRDDKSSMPYKVRMDETGLEIWYHESDLLPEPAKTFTVCVSTTPINHKGNFLKGNQYIIENVQSLEQVPRTGVMTGFCGLTDLKGLLEKSMSQFFSENRTEPFEDSYKYVYTVIDGNLVAAVDAEFVPTQNQYKVGYVYQLDEDTPTLVGDYSLPKGQLVKLVGKEDEDYEGEFVYHLNLLNSDEYYWVGLGLKMTQL